MTADSVTRLGDVDSDYFVSTLAGESAFMQLRDEWNRLWMLSAEATQFQRWEWQYLFYKHMAPRSKPEITVVRDSEGRCVALAVLCIAIDVESGLPKIAFLGDSYADYHMILCEPRLPHSVGHRILDQALKLSNRQASLLDLGNLPEGCWTEASASTYVQELPLPRALLVRKKTETYSVKLPRSLDTYLHQLGPRTRRDFAYDRRRLEKEFAVGWRVFGDSQHSEDCLSAIETIDRARWQSDSRYCDPGKRAFLISLARAQAEVGIHLAFVLYLNRLPAAYVAGAVVRKSYKIESIGHDPRIAQSLSIGKVLNFYAIEACINRGLIEYDLTRGSEAYKTWLGADPHNNFHFRFYRSRVNRSLDALGKTMMTILRRQRPLRRFYQRFIRGMVQ